MSESIAVSSLLCDLYHVFSAPRRCYAIKLLAHTESQSIDVRELSQQITAVEQSVCKKHATGEAYRNVYNALSQTHLDTMSRKGLIDYDSQRQQVTPKQPILVSDSILRLNRILFLLSHGYLATD